MLALFSPHRLVFASPDSWRPTARGCEALTDSKQLSLDPDSPEVAERYKKLIELQEALDNLYTPKAVRARQNLNISMQVGAAKDFKKDPNKGFAQPLKKDFFTKADLAICEAEIALAEAQQFQKLDDLLKSKPIDDETFREYKKQHKTADITAFKLEQNEAAFKELVALLDRGSIQEPILKEWIESRTNYQYNALKTCIDDYSKNKTPRTLEAAAASLLGSISGGGFIIGLARRR